MSLLVFDQNCSVRAWRGAFPTHFITGSLRNSVLIFALQGCILLEIFRFSIFYNTIVLFYCCCLNSKVVQYRHYSVIMMANRAIFAEWGEFFGGSLWIKCLPKYRCRHAGYRGENMTQAYIADLLTGLSIFVITVSIFAGFWYSAISQYRAFRRRRRLKKIGRLIEKEGAEILTWDSRGIPVLMRAKKADGDSTIFEVS